MKKLISKMLVAALSVSMLVGCGSSQKDSVSETVSSESAISKSDGSTLRINIASEPDYLDPALTTTSDGGTLAANSFTGLFVHGKNEKVVPALCKDYKISEDGLTYTFTLKDGLKWSDNSELTAADFEYAWKRAANPKTGVQYAYLFDIFAKDSDGNINVKADGNTLTAVLINSCPYFLELCALSTFYPVPKTAVEAADPGGTNPGAWASEAGFVTNGAYTLQKWNHNESMVYVKNPNFYDAANVKVEKLEFMLSADDTATFSAYNAGNLDFIDSVPTDEISTVDSNVDFKKIDQIGTYYITFNVNADLFKGMSAENAAKMRQALSILIDRGYIIDNIAQTGQELATSFIPTGMSDGNGGEFKSDSYNYPDKESKGYFSKDFDAAEAKNKAVDLLKSIGYKFDENGKLSSETPINIEYTLNVNSGHQSIAEAIQSDWSAIGVNMTIKTEEWQTFGNDRRAGAFTVARDGWNADYSDPVNMLEMFLTSSGNNHAQFGKDPSNPSAPEWNSYDALIKQIYSTPDFAERAKLMHQAEDRLMSTWAVVPLYYYNDIYMCKTNVKGIYKTKNNHIYFMYASVDK
ncbi:peptide ABC transporter substrate-binding protein [Anaerosacchariphilus polymeriproducens]|uniref:Peptide ABC transporter substrate-binding protein n=1 Tax=Anaerosacchariphilus polymeriproducens TaxID=1812858 RepID=A0A371AZZ2_9FIRM|nr:peptide ABC transporter substrate-binding protein [Anaerosacchariphilus polymeriproducens]RDU25131.1 peptide ABC transporter substrate-binding protein [Anaerosacchariphilus polymeriproducens]